ncbi:MAG: ATP-binding cassette domain-containing protein [Zetaproteobacteria bacterium]|nr:ATP-binding cassette domain-containing protein [Zetaproteobacteria bacterium]
MIKISNLSVKFEEQRVLENISFSVAEGERLSLVGTGGSGKTTLFKALLGLVHPCSGQVWMDECQVSKLSAGERRQFMRKVGVAFQQGGLFDDMTVYDNLSFAMEHLTEVPRAQHEGIIEDLLQQVKLGGSKRLYPHELSGGMKRRVGIARALCNRPQIALFDEPTAGLDPVTSTIILNMIVALTGEVRHGCAVVATSNTEIAIRFAERIVVLHEGRVVADGLWKELLLHGSDWVRYFLGARFIGLDESYMKELGLPEAFIENPQQGQVSA